MTMAISRKQGGNKLVWFSSHHRPFDMAEMYCTNPDCPCRTVTLEFSERNADGTAVPRPISFSVCLDLETWQEAVVSQRGELESWLVEEFRGNLSEQMKETFRQTFHRRRRTVKRLASFTMPLNDVLQGRLIRFSEILRPEEDIDAEYARVSFSFRLMYENQTYFVNDLYCPNPACKCKEVHLEFLDYRETGPDSPMVSNVCLLKLSFDNKVEIVDADRCSHSRARELVRQWRASHPRVLDLLKWRYREVKKIGKRILQKGDLSARGIPPVADSADSNSLRGLPGVSPSSLLGRRDSSTIRVPAKARPNAPCPCGSGKKYKKCCGRRA